MYMYSQVDANIVVVLYYITCIWNILGRSDAIVMLCHGSY